MRALLGMLGLVFVTSCAHHPTGGMDGTGRASSGLVTHYRVAIEAALDDQQVAFVQTSSFTSLADGDDVHTIHFEALPAWVTDLSSAGSGERQDLEVSVRPSRLDGGVIFYEVMIVHADASTPQPFGLTENPGLSIASGDTAVVHLAQEAGEVYSRFTLDLNPVDAAD
ncbi:hypothetical protein Mmar10_2411 [Maricaulis maris MCS10]|uniref:Lipoprotein n=1 Tax=Maricaulis maris (strain MCS10) TaxID=394221 RepID=Q0ALZ0_MARMM|nr:hypothetical protein [Maricaulis maris]ABI66703.1 hypothetical protein Mmar10_2411 [Maricaulis maris MCS10]